MTTNTETPETQLVIIEDLEIEPIQAFSENGLQPVIDKIREEALSHVPDTSTLKGRQAIASVANKVAKSKTGLVTLRKDLVADMKARCKVIDKEGSRMEEELNKIKAEVRQPLSDWEDDEAGRIANIKEEIAMMKSLASTSSTYDLDSTGLQESRDVLFNMKIVHTQNEKTFDEFNEEGMVVKEESLKRLDILIDQAKKSEADAIELENLRKEKEERDAKDAEAEEKRVEQKRLDDIAAQEELEKVNLIHNRITALKDHAINYLQYDLTSDELLARVKQLDEVYAPGTYGDYESQAKEAKEDASSSLEVQLKTALKWEAEEKAKQEKIDEAQRQATIEEAKQEERDAIQKENAEAEAAKQKREANAKHRLRYHANAAAAFETLDIPAAKAGELVEAIASNMIPNVTINY